MREGGVGHAAGGLAAAELAPRPVPIQAARERVAGGCAPARGGGGSGRTGMEGGTGEGLRESFVGWSVYAT